MAKNVQRVEWGEDYTVEIVDILQDFDVQFITHPGIPGLGKVDKVKVVTLGARYKVKVVG